MTQTPSVINLEIKNIADILKIIFNKLITTILISIGIVSNNKYI